MSHLVVVAFDGVDDAADALRSLQILEWEGRLRLLDTAMVARNATGKVRVTKEVRRATEAGALIGALLGSLLLFVCPLAGALAGAVVGALLGRLRHRGIDEALVRDVRDGLVPGSSALLLLSDRAEADALAAALRPVHGTVSHSTRSPALVAALPGLPPGGRR